MADAENITNGCVTALTSGSNSHSSTRSPSPTPSTSPTTPEVLPPPVINMEWYNRMIGAADHFSAETTAQLRVMQAWQHAYAGWAERVEAVLGELQRHRDRLTTQLREEQRRGRAIWSELAPAKGNDSGEYLDGAFADQFEAVKCAGAVLAAQRIDWAAEVGKLPIELRNAWRAVIELAPVQLGQT